MYWNLAIDTSQDEEGYPEFTVEGKDWYTALKQGLHSQGLNGLNPANLLCRIESDKRITVSDALSRCTYSLTPVATSDEEEEESETTKSPLSKGTSSTSPLEEEEQGELSSSPFEKGGRGDLESASSTRAEREFVVNHQVFHSKVEKMDDAGGLFNRELFISVDPSCDHEAATTLAVHYFNELKQLGSPEDGKGRYISICVFDHPFEDQAERPAMVSLTWGDWSHQPPKIRYPELEQRESQFDIAPAEEKSSQRERDDSLVIAFEKVQEVYAYRDHDKAAAKILAIAEELIPCESGSCMLISPGKYALYVAAAMGAGAQERKGKPVSITEGLVGFSTKNSAVLNLQDPETDSRYDAEHDEPVGIGKKSHNLLCAPMIHDRMTVGAIALFNSPKLEGFTEEDGEVLQYLANSFAEFFCTSLPSREADFTDQEFEGGVKKSR